MKNFFTINFKWFVIAGGLILAFMLWRGCGNSKENEKVIELERQLRAKDSTDAVSKQVIAAREADALQMAGERDSALLLAQARANQLKVVRPVIIRWKDRIINQTDSATCDSLARMQENLLWLIDDYANNLTFAQMRSDSIEITKDLIITELTGQLAVCNNALDYASKEVVPSIKRRIEFYAGPSAIGSKETIFEGYGAGIGILTRKGQFWQADALIINGKPHYQIGGKFRLSFRKH